MKATLYQEQITAVVCKGTEWACRRHLCEMILIAVHLNYYVPILDDDHVDGVRLRLWTEATNGPVVDHPTDMSVENHGAMMSTGESYWFVHKSALWQSYQHSHLMDNQEELGDGNDGFCLRNISFLLVEFWDLKSCGMGLHLYFHSEGRRAADFYRP
jgi:hypothetical protein